VTALRPAGAGGSGLVVLAIPTTFAELSSIAVGLVYTLDTTNRPGFRVYRFTGGTGLVTI
jgi:hypothetical protein